MWVDVRALVLDPAVRARWTKLDHFDVLWIKQTLLTMQLVCHREMSRELLQKFDKLVYRDHLGVLSFGLG